MRCWVWRQKKVAKLLPPEVAVVVAVVVAAAAVAAAVAAAAAAVDRLGGENERVGSLLWSLLQSLPRNGSVPGARLLMWTSGAHVVG
ncbi:hypothetical protein [Brevundimonas sp.]|uniref:hypothetical protein n=1 Tax=Brevundimonas sp. TaxID=1871086 RepID=UPI0039192602